MLDALVYLGGSAVDRELAVAIGREKRVRDIRKHLDKLVQEGILELHGDRYCRHGYSGIWLTMERMLNGELEAEERQKEEHRRQREAFLSSWEK